MKRRPRPATAPGTQGFTLVEVLVAFVLAAVGLGTLFSGIAGAVMANRRGELERRGLGLAQALLDQAGVVGPLAPGRGDTADGFRWSLSVTRPGPAKPPFGSADPAPPGAGGPSPSRPGAGSPPPGRPGERGPPAWVDVEVQAPGGPAVRLGALKASPAREPPR